MSHRFFKLIFCKLLAITILSHFFIINLSAQNDKFKALFIYNFTRHIEWPEKNANNFRIMVMGNSGLTNELNEIATKKTVGTKTIVAVETKSSADISDCQIVFISKNSIDELSNVLKRVKNANTLVITDAENACLLGAGINFITKNGNLNFEISKTNISASGLKISSNLLSMGILVN